MGFVPTQEVKSRSRSPMRTDSWSQQGGNYDEGAWARKAEALEAKWARKAEAKKVEKAEREALWLASPAGQKWIREEQAKKAAVQDMASSWTNNMAPPFRSDFLGRYAPSDIQAANHVRRELGIEVQSDASAPGLTPAPMQSWSDIGILPPWMQKSMQEHSWEAPMPIQAQAIPILLSGRNLIGIAQTGSGKTIAFMVPAVIQAHDQRPLSENDKGPIVLVLAPTRELAVQISEEAEKLVKYSHESSSHPGGLRSVCFYGGGKKWEQLQQFSYEGSHVVVATPGRLLDCVGEGHIPLNRVTYFCLDEADRMLDMGFLGDMENLSSTIRPDRQMVFFSATWPSEVQSLAYNLSSSGEPVTIRVAQAGREHQAEALCARECIRQQVVVIDEPEGRGKWDRQDEIKKQLLDAHIKQVLASDSNAKILVFVNQKTFADELANKLWEDNIHADTIHGGKKQDLRLSALDSFRRGDTRVLIATDVVGRGVDIPFVTHVVVYSMNSVQDYIHRIGRTGRGKDATGHALVFFEYTAKQPEIAGELIDVLVRSNQGVPPELQQIADEVKSGIREDFNTQFNGGGGWKSGGNDWKAGGNDWKSAGNDWKNGWNASGGSEWKSTDEWKPDAISSWTSSPQAVAFPNAYVPWQPSRIIVEE